MDIRFREIQIADAPAITGLSIQLGYDISIAETEKNLQSVLNHPDHFTMAAVHDDKVVGWIHANQRLLLETPPFIEIMGLVVDTGYRNKGIGESLINMVKQWCMEKNIHSLKLRTNIKRKDAHRFYERMGFREIKQQKIYLITNWELGIRN